MAPLHGRATQRKRAKSASRVVPRGKSHLKAGQLSQLMSMPMDILMEIFGHLHPLNLLHLARTTKAFRRILMHKSSVFLWKAARANVPGLPDCPPDLSEPQWANLVFDPHCHFCIHPNIRTVDWLLRIRICAECTKLHLTDGAIYFDDDDFDYLFGAITIRCGRYGRSEFLIDEYEQVKNRYHAIEDSDARDTFVEMRQQLIEQIEEHASLCIAWADAKALLRSDELDHLRASRQQAIVEKLVSLGWGDEIDKIPDLVKTPQLLTERIWKNISKQMIEYMEEMKTKRLARELVQLHTRRKL